MSSRFFVFSYPTIHIAEAHINQRKHICAESKMEWHKGPEMEDTFLYGLVWSGIDYRG